MISRNKSLTWGISVLLVLLIHQGPLSSIGRILANIESGSSRIKLYSQEHISRAAPNMKHVHPRLLVFNGANFEVYNLNHNDVHYRLNDPYPRRGLKAIPLLVHALMQLNPARFEPGQPVFQLLFSDSDSISSPCVNSDSNCPVEEFSPWLLFGSAPANSSEMPTVKAFPHWFYLSCLYEYKMNNVMDCQWPETIDRTVSWDDLRPTLIWRGSDFGFIHLYNEFKFTGPKLIDLANLTTRNETVQALLQRWDYLTPRWRGVALSVEADLKGESWIDNKFVPSRIGDASVHQAFMERNVLVEAPSHMTSVDMGKFKYQIDYGGGGGTSWRGSITKLGMPGLLFHHETRSKDWFFDDMEPWEHYVPIAWHLGDLREKFDWAEKHQDEAKRIADNASKLFDRLMSKGYMEKLYQELFVDYLGAVVDAFVPFPASWEEARRKYENDGFVLRQVGICDSSSCRIQGVGEMPTKSRFPQVQTQI